MTTATLVKMERTGYDEVAYGKFIAKQAKGIQKAAIRENARGGHQQPTDMESCLKSAESLAGMYRHHFRTYRESV
jgi:predicted Ser/Thr protein kinase